MQVSCPPEEPLSPFASSLWPHPPGPRAEVHCNIQADGPRARTHLCRACALASRSSSPKCPPLPPLFLTFLAVWAFFGLSGPCWWNFASVGKGGGGDLRVPCHPFWPKFACTCNCRPDFSLFGDFLVCRVFVG